MKSLSTELYEKFDYEPESVYDKTVLITGGTTGIGRATALLLAAQGAHVMIFGRHEQELNDALDDLRQITLEQNILGLQADVSKPEDVQRIFSEVDKQFKKLDILINNAALPYNSVMDGTFEDWQEVVNTNLMGYLACTHEAVERMKQASDGGHIVNIGSMSADVHERGSSVYVATKSAIQGFSKSLSKEVNPMGIRVTLIEPGSVGTDMEEEPPHEQRKMEKQMKMLKAEDIAACVLYALTQPKRCEIAMVQIRPHLQSI